jgi:DNA processing protein
MAQETINQNKADRIDWLTLKLTPALGNRCILKLIKRFGSPSAVLRAGAEDLCAIPGLREKARAALQNRDTIRHPGTEWERLEREGIRLLSLLDPDYPANLAAIPDPPAVLFMKGTVEARDLVAVAVVGSRAASPLGMAFTERLCMDLSQSGVTIVSGLAVGIDSAAHRGALKGKGRTLAVLGCGLDIEYPRVNSALRQQIIAAGALFSEFPLETSPAPVNFPMRNRIISGLALGVVVVEAAHRSGSLITARMALEQGREVFAVPGTARHYRSIGPHRLLKQGAKLVESAEDVLEEIRPLIRPSWVASPREEKPAAAGSDADETSLLAVLDQHPRHIDAICRDLQWPMARVMAVLLTLELKGSVQQLPGKYFVRFSAEFSG